MAGFFEQHGTSLVPKAVVTRQFLPGCPRCRAVGIASRYPRAERGEPTEYYPDCGHPTPPPGPVLEHDGLVTDPILAFGMMLMRMGAKLQRWANGDRDG